MEEEAVRLQGEQAEPVRSLWAAPPGAATLVHAHSQEPYQRCLCGRWVLGLSNHMQNLKWPAISPTAQTPGTVELRMNALTHRETQDWSAAPCATNQIHCGQQWTQLHKRSDCLHSCIAKSEKMKNWVFLLCGYL